MPSSAPAKRLSKLASQIPEDTVVWDALQGLVNEHSLWADHAIALIGSSYVEKALEVGITTRLMPLTKSERDALFSYESRGPLSDLSSRIKLAYAFRVVGPKTRDDLEHIRAIRNAFAHSIMPVGFEIKEVSDICDLLFTHNDLGLLSVWVNGNSPRARYINTTLSLGSKLKQKIQVARGIVMAVHDRRAFPVPFLP